MIAAELRAEMARQGVSQRELARRLGTHNPRVSARIGMSAAVELTFADVLEMTEALGVSAERFLLPLLPRLDSNQQPSGYPLSLVRGGASATEGRIWWPDAAQPAPSGPKPRLVLVEAVAS